MNEDLAMRFKDASWYPNKKQVFTLIGGAGGIGSWLALFLARAGFIPYVFDADTVDPHNIGGQLYKTDNIDELKVTALSNLIHDFAGTTIRVDNGWYGETSMTSKFTFAAFDNMKARKLMYDKWLKSLPEDETARTEYIFIDGRLLAEQLQIFTIRGNDKKSMEEYSRVHLFDDSAVEDGPCSLRQTTHVAALIASMMTSIFINHYDNVNAKRDIRTVPFRYEYYTPMLFNEMQMP